MPPSKDRAAFTVDLRDLGRGAGRNMPVELAELAPDGWGNAVIGVIQGSIIAVDLTLESVVEGVLVQGTAEVQVAGQCGRCLDPVERTMSVRFDELFRYADQIEGADDEDLPVLEGELLDLESTVRDAIVLALPLAPRCRDDCPGLCSDCGARLADHPGHRHDQIDSRWAELATMFEETKRPPGSQ